MSTEHPEHQTKDAPLRRSEEEADETNPDVDHDPTDDQAEPEEVASQEQWVEDEQDNPRSRN